MGSRDIFRAIARAAVFSALATVQLLLASAPVVRSSQALLVAAAVVGGIFAFLVLVLSFPFILAARNDTRSPRTFDPSAKSEGKRRAARDLLVLFGFIIAVEYCFAAYRHPDPYLSLFGLGVYFGGFVLSALVLLIGMI